MPGPSRFLSLLLLLPLSAVLQGQQLQWAASMGGGEWHTQEAHGVAVAPDGAVITVGQFVGGIDLDSGAGHDLHAGSNFTRAFIQKLDADGHYLWGHSLGGAGPCQALGVAVDDQGHLLITGGITGAADLDPGPGEHLVATVNSSMDAFVVKLDADGQFLWGRLVGGANNDLGLAVATGGDGHITVVGELGAQGDLDPGAGVAIAGGHGLKDAFVLRLDAEGNFVWGFAVGGPGHDMAHGVAVAADGAVFVAGEFRQTVDFDPGPGEALRSSQGADDLFLMKLDGDGQLQWVHGIGGTGSERARAVAVGPDGGPVITGRLTSDSDFAPGAEPQVVASSIFEDMFLAKYEPAGELAWAFTLSSYLNEGLALAVDDQDRVYLAGVFGVFFNDLLDLDPAPETAFIDMVGGLDGLLVSYGPDGNFRWGFSLGSAEIDQAHAVAVGDQGQVVVAGQFRLTMDVDPGPGSLLLQATHGHDAFVARYTQDITTDLHDAGPAPWATLFPNPATDHCQVLFSGPGPHRWSLCDAAGRLVHGPVRQDQPSAQIPVQQLAPGLYHLLVGDAHGRWLRSPLVVGR